MCGCERDSKASLQKDKDETLRPEFYSIYFLMLFNRPLLQIPRFFSTTRQILAKGGAADGAAGAAKPKNKKPSQIKEVTLSWLISKNDLEGQKRKAIESILSRGNKLQVKLENRNKKFHIPTDNEMEARNNLLENVQRIVETAGGSQAKPPQGNIKSRMMLYFAPK